MSRIIIRSKAVYKMAERVCVLIIISQITNPSNFKLAVPHNQGSTGGFIKVF